MPRDQRLQLRDLLVMTPERQLSVDRVLDGNGTELLQPLCLLLRPILVEEVGEGGTMPESQRLPEQLRCALGVNEALLGDTLGVADTLHTTGALDDGPPLDYAWGVRVFRVGSNRVQSHGGSWDNATSKLVRLPDLGVSFAALADDGSVERMIALAASLQDELLSGSAQASCR